MNILMGATIEFDGVDVQVLILSLAELALSRPRWSKMVDTLVYKIAGTQGLELYEEFKHLNADRVGVERRPLRPEQKTRGRKFRSEWTGDKDGKVDTGVSGSTAL